MNSIPNNPGKRISELPFYVYQLEYPDNTPFYIGLGTMGTGRSGSHARNARRDASHNAELGKIIRDVESTGQAIVVRILARFALREDAAAFEHYKVSTTDGLVNIMLRAKKSAIEKSMKASISAAAEPVETEPAQGKVEEIQPIDIEKHQRRQAAIDAVLAEWRRLF